MCPARRVRQARPPRSPDPRVHQASRVCPVRKASRGSPVPPRPSLDQQVLLAPREHLAPASTWLARWRPSQPCQHRPPSRPGTPTRCRPMATSTWSTPPRPATPTWVRCRGLLVLPDHRARPAQPPRFLALQGLRDPRGTRVPPRRCQAPQAPRETRERRVLRVPPAQCQDLRAARDPRATRATRVTREPLVLPRLCLVPLVLPVPPGPRWCITVPPPARPGQPVPWSCSGTARCSPTTGLPTMSG